MDFLGTDYGGKSLDLSLIPNGSTIVSAGIGTDISFDIELIDKKSCNIIGIDPTPKSHAFIANYQGLKNFTLIKKALNNVANQRILIYKNVNPKDVSESFLRNHSNVCDWAYYYADTITLVDIFQKYNNISVLKMDIEGSEYKVLEGLDFVPDSIRQICVEFHHFCTNYTEKDTLNIINLMTKFGFTKCHPQKEHSLVEVTLVRA